MDNHQVTPTMAIIVNLRNPGQFYACCGLLELAYRLWGVEACGWFDSTRFCLHVSERSQDDVNQQLMDLLRMMTFVATDEDDSGSPILVGIGDGCTYRVDWWTKTIYWKGSLRTWGRGTSYNLMTESHREGLKAEDIVSGFDLTAKMTSRLSVDPRASWTAIDAGFSPNDQNFTVATFPLVEFLAGIGLQRNRPAPDKRQRWCYTAWKTPLPSPLISTAKQVLPSSQTVLYRFEIASRGQMARYFTHSTEGENE
ncbi:hypothetical protein LCGC14_2611320 [marine sediment metagenome]|uniref:Uncharacterized protein n=1 Tax=marine sediment metagenome TaxID=412755 RepID=A0A0F9ATF2_9ZZZZ